MLEKTEYGYINEYRLKYGESLLNIKGVKKVTKKMSEFKVEMENQKQFEDTPNANMADLSAGPGLVARKRG